ncbi:MAG: UvrD-helicase domain-containing protein [Prolixibacteraceae bacterium]|nr:UvrD-helicase domain-containing protein [Prolixibacteraceae bacterium]
MSQLKVYKASAGSGKTFRLAIEYMKLALTNEANYRHILAVTFTNKATAEMKSRIIGELYRLAQGHQTAYLEVLTSELRWPPMQVQRQAQLVLKRLLHDYSRFSISTIDSFFQRVIKAFNRELGINAAYNVELDEKSILEEAADRLIQSVENDEKLLEWLDAFASEKMRDGKGWNLKKDIIRLGSEIYNETFKSLNNELYEKLNDRQFLKGYREKLGKIISQYESQLKALGQEGLNVMAAEGVLVDDFKGKGRGPATVFQKLKELKTDFSNTILAAADDSSAWVTGTVKEPQKSKLTAVAENHLMPKLQQALRIVEADSRNYITAKLIVSQLFTLGILVDLRRVVKELCREKGVILISDSGHLLKEVIAESEAPFVYEKTGSVYSHFMIDEFQDTSGLQWNNFKPLIGNSLSEDNLGMVVGDVKQAIYRWRSGDWRLLAGKLGESFPAFGLQNEVLNSNWRSHGNVIRFNNTLFRVVPEIIQQQMNNELAEAGIAENPVLFTVPEVYADSVQKVSNESVSQLGYVRVKFLESKTDQKVINEELILSELADSIRQLQDNGVKAFEIAILVRKKEEARIVSDLFLQQKSLVENRNYNFDILSGESLFINNSDIIGFIVAVLTGFLNPDDQVTRAAVSHFYFQKIFPRLEQLGKGPDLAKEAEDRSRKTEGRSRSSEAYRREAVEGKQSKASSSVPQSFNQQFELLNADENELIQFLSGKDFQEMISGRPILEIIYNICEKFNLYSLADELAYLQAFVDQISVFERSYPSELTSFLNWWGDNGGKFTIPVSESIDAIHVLTIHKSKGLEFTHVFVPFFDWSVHPSASPEMAPLLWCRPEIEPFSEMELVPVRFKKDVGGSIFYREYFTEKFNTYVDNLNLMYVAFTRAKASLWIWAGFNNKVSTVGDLLKLAVENQAGFGTLGLPENLGIQLALVYHPEEMMLEIGELDNLKTDQKKPAIQNDERLTSFEFADFRKFLHIRQNGEDFFSRENKRQSGINRGKLIHEVLSLIETTKDLDQALNRIVWEGKLESPELAGLKEQLLVMLNDGEVKSWFDGSFRIVNERSILTGMNGIKRPDRIMIGENEVIVVDYKSGESELDKYKYQLRSYIRELKNCGYQNVSGYIWYTRMNKRIAV